MTQSMTDDHRSVASDVLTISRNLSEHPSGMPGMPGLLLVTPRSLNHPEYVYELIDLVYPAAGFHTIKVDSDRIGGIMSVRDEVRSAPPLGHPDNPRRALIIDATELEFEEENLRATAKLLFDVVREDARDRFIPGIIVLI